MTPQIVSTVVKRGRKEITVTGEVVHQGYDSVVVRLLDDMGFDLDHRNWKKGFLQFLDRKDSKPVEVSDA
jgi:hypothetical protein